MQQKCPKQTPTHHCWDPGSPESLSSSFPNSCQCSVACGRLSSALILIRSTSKETGRRLTDLVALPFINAVPSGFREDKIPGLGTNTSTRSRDQYPQNHMLSHLVFPSEPQQSQPQILVNYFNSPKIYRESTL